MAATLAAVSIKNAVGGNTTPARVMRNLPHIKTNVSSTERAVSLVAAGGLAVCGFDGRGPGLMSTLAGGFLAYRAATGNCPFYQMLNFSTSESTAPSTAVSAGHGARIRESITVAKPVAEVYRYWRDFENLPRFMAHLVDVNTSTDGTSRWTARGPLGLQVEWEAQIVQDRPNELIAWQSLPGSDLDTAGSVAFQELSGGQGTRLMVNMKYDPPAGKLGTLIQKYLGTSPQQQIREDLRRFQQIMETGQMRL